MILLFDYLAMTAPLRSAQASSPRKRRWCPGRSFKSQWFGWRLITHILDDFDVLAGEANLSPQVSQRITQAHTLFRLNNMFQDITHLAYRLAAHISCIRSRTDGSIRPPVSDHSKNHSFDHLCSWHPRARRGLGRDGRSSINSSLGEQRPDDPRSGSRCPEADYRFSGLGRQRTDIALPTELTFQRTVGRRDSTSVDRQSGVQDRAKANSGSISWPSAARRASTYSPRASPASIRLVRPQVKRGSPMRAMSRSAAKRENLPFPLGKG
jgi:hypothetical protein